MIQSAVDRFSVLPSHSHCSRLTCRKRAREARHSGRGRAREAYGKENPAQENCHAMPAG